METKLIRIAQIAKERPKEVFTSLYHHLNEEILVKCHEELKGDKAVGVDEIAKANYAENLKENIHHLVEALKKHSYKPPTGKKGLLNLPRFTGHQVKSYN